VHHVAHPSRKKGNKKLLAFYGVYTIILSSPRQCQIEKLFDREYQSPCGRTNKQNIQKNMNSAYLCQAQDKDV
jgi:hypothetical protein